MDAETSSAAAGRTFGQYIGGEWTSTGGVTRAVIRPYDGRQVGRVAVGTVDDARRAINAAHDALSPTAVPPAHARHTILCEIEQGLRDRREELARGIVDEAGKTIRDARTEVDRAALVFSLAADEARRATGGDVLPLDLNPASNGRIGLTRRFPAGVVGAITPFNFPLNLVAHKVAPAIAAGCPLVLKPAERTSLTALRLAEIIARTDLPPGAFNVVTPPEPQSVADLFVEDDRVRVLSFTGSDKIGWGLRARAPRKRVLLELGGNAAVVIGDDYGDAAGRAHSVARCVAGSFANAGQVCISVQRIFVPRAFFAEWTARFVEETQKLIVGDPHDDATDIGPLITPHARAAAQALVDEAIAGGATTLLRGEETGRANLSPTILTNVSPAARVVTDEAFAPVVVVEPYDDWAEALSCVNQSRFGLQAGVFTRDINRIFQAFATLEVGGVIANDTPQYRMDNMPYGGEKDSGMGREGVRYAIEEMTCIRLLALNLA